MKYVHVLLALFLTALPSWAGAATYTVSPDGSDTDSGSRDKPFRTVQKAVDVMHPGDTCTVRGGTYREAVCAP